VENEYDDVQPSQTLADGSGRIDVFAHSYGANIAPLEPPLAVQRFDTFIALYEPQAPKPFLAEWVNQMTALIANGNPGPGDVQAFPQLRHHRPVN